MICVVCTDDYKSKDGRLIWLVKNNVLWLAVFKCTERFQKTSIVFLSVEDNPSKEKKVCLKETCTCGQHFISLLVFLQFPAGLFFYRKVIYTLHKFILSWLLRKMCNMLCFHLKQKIHLEVITLIWRYKMGFIKRFSGQLL